MVAKTIMNLNFLPSTLKKYKIKNSSKNDILVKRCSLISSKRIQNVKKIVTDNLSAISSNPFICEVAKEKIKIFQKSGLALLMDIQFHEKPMQIKQSSKPKK